MQCNLNQSSYPTLLEALRFIAVSFDLKGGNKRIDDKCFEQVDPRQVDAFVTELFETRIEKSIGFDVSSFINQQINLLKVEYITLIKMHNADGVTRNQLLDLLNQYVFPYWVANFFRELHEKFAGPSTASLFVEHHLAVPLVMEWASKNLQSWEKLLKSFDKDKQDMLSQWKKGYDLPSIYSISLIPIWAKELKIENENIEQIQLLLLMGRAIDYWRKLDSGRELVNSVLLQLWHKPGEMLTKYRDSIQRIQNTALQNNVHIHRSIAQLQKVLQPHIPKKMNDQQETRKALNVFRKHFSEKNVLPGIQYWLDWSEAKWHVFSGDLDTANNFYQKAFEGSLYQGGINTKYIIDQSLVIASSLVKPDKVFIKHLKWALLQFKFDIPSVSKEKASIKFADNVENWEITAWKNNFYRFFPKEGLFSGVEFDEDLTPVMMYQTKKEVKPDFRNPNRKVNVAENDSLKMPQLNWFIIEKDFESFSKLIEKGANPNVSSDSKDTPLQLALRILSTKGLEKTSFDDRFFWKIAELPHDKNIVNQPSEKKRHLPLILGVESGRPEIVEKLLEMGADPNQRGQTDNQTALNVCLKLINTVKNPESFIRNQLNHPVTPELLDSYRRHSNGMAGASLDQNIQFHEMLNNSPLGKMFNNSLYENQLNQFRKLNKESLKHIAAMLILNGADVNAEHDTPIKGYTPLMLAAENNEKKLFQLMLEKGGNPKKSYSWEGRSIDCWTITQEFSSDETLEILKKTQLH